MIGCGRLVRHAHRRNRLSLLGVDHGHGRGRFHGFGRFACGLRGGGGAWRVRRKLHGRDPSGLGCLQIVALRHHTNDGQLVCVKRLNKRCPVDRALHATGVEHHGFPRKETASLLHAFGQRLSQRGEFARAQHGTQGVECGALEF